MNSLQSTSTTLATSTLGSTRETLSTAIQPASDRGALQDPVTSQVRALRGSSLPPEPAPSNATSNALPTPVSANSTPTRTNDLIWRNYGSPDANVNGRVSLWTMNGVNPTGTIQIPLLVPNPAWEIVGSGDFNKDGQADLVWRNYGSSTPEAGLVNIWIMNGNSPIGTIQMPLRVDNPNWRIEGVGDFNNDGNPDIVWRNYATTGAEAGLVNIWTMNGVNPTGTISMPLRVDNPNWRIDAIGDFNNDGNPDLVWRNYATSGGEAGLVNIWTMNGVNPMGTIQMPLRVDNPNWRIEGVGDFNNDGNPDLVWRNYATSGGEAGLVNIWTMNGVNPMGTIQMPLRVTDPNWRIDGVRTTTVTNPNPPTGVTQITNNNLEDGDPRISGANLVWSAFDGNDQEIFLYNGTTGTITQLTNNTVDDYNPQISGLNVVWQRENGVANNPNSDLYFYDGTSTRQLTNSPYMDFAPTLSGDRIAWISMVDIDPSPNGVDLASTVFSYRNAPGVTPQPVSANSKSLKRPVGFSGANLIWVEEDGGTATYSIRMFDAASQASRVLATSNPPIGGVRVSGNTVVWETIAETNNSGNNPGSGSGNTLATMELFALNLTTNVRTKIVTAESQDSTLYLNISGNAIVWTAFDGNDTEVFLWNGTAVQQLTNNNIRESYPAIDGSNIIWVDESNDIYRYNSSGTVKIGTGDGISLPVISGNTVAWSAVPGGGSGDSEIFLARI